VSSSEYTLPSDLDLGRALEENYGVGINCAEYWFSDMFNDTAKVDDAYHVWNNFLWCDDNEAMRLYIPEGKEVFALNDCQGKVPSLDPHRF
jgi:hypothetical protein